MNLKRNLIKNDGVRGKKKKKASAVLVIETKAPDVLSRTGHSGISFDESG